MMVERRKHNRFSLARDTVAAAFITNSLPHFVMAARVTDIGHGGLALSHLGGRLPQGTSLELNILLPGKTLSIRNLTGERIWDKNTQGQLPTRRCGMRFLNITDDQKALVEYLIRNHTTAAAKS
jgi:hypothetical protein